jgi:lysophospholipid acyltransferase (LPLAT)-like uncharacterized protein
MRLWKDIGRQRWAKVALGVAAAEYLRFVALTSRFAVEPADIYERVGADQPIILALWHGQHFLLPFAREAGVPAKLLISRHHDGEINAIAAEWFGVGTIRGSGNLGKTFVRKGGVVAFQAMLDALAEGFSVVLSADVPKMARVAGLGIIKLAQASGRPIYGAAYATNRRFVLNNWDRTTINLPFSRASGVVTEPVRVTADAGAEELEACRSLLEDRLSAATQRAYEIVDRSHRGD